MAGLPAATTAIRELVTNPAAADSSGKSYLAVDRIQDSGANPCIVEWTRAFANAGDILDLSTLAGRVPAATSDAITRASMGEVGLGLVNPSNTVDTARSAGATGYLIGALNTAGAQSAVSVGPVNCNTITTSLVAVANFAGIVDKAVRKRGFMIVSSCNIAFTLTIQGQLSATTGYQTICTLSMASGSQVLLVDSAGALAIAGTSTASAGSTHLDAPLGNLQLLVSAGSTPASGTYSIDYIGAC